MNALIPGLIAIFMSLFAIGAATQGASKNETSPPPASVEEIASRDPGDLTTSTEKPDADPAAASENTEKPEEGPETSENSEKPGEGEEPMYADLPLAIGANDGKTTLASPAPGVASSDLLGTSNIPLDGRPFEEAFDEEFTREVLPAPPVEVASAPVATQERTPAPPVEPVAAPEQPQPPADPFAPGWFARSAASGSDFQDIFRLGQDLPAPVREASTRLRTAEREYDAAEEAWEEAKAAADRYEGRRARRTQYYREQLARLRATETRALDTLNAKAAARRAAQTEFDRLLRA